MRRPFEKAEVKFDSMRRAVARVYDNKGTNTQSFFFDPFVKLVFDIQSDEKYLRTKMDYSSFIRAFRQIVSYLTNAQKMSYEEVLRGRMPEDEFMQIAEGIFAGNTYRQDASPSKTSRPWQRRSTAPSSRCTSYSHSSMTRTSRTSRSHPRIPSVCASKARLTP